MLIKNARNKSVVLSLAIIAVIVAVASRVQQEGNPQTVPHQITSGSKEILSAQTDIGPQPSHISDVAPSPANAKPVSIYQFETQFAPGKATVIPDVFSTPSAAESVVRSARLNEVLAGNLSSLREGDTLNLPLPDNSTAKARVNLIQQEADGQVLVGGSLEGEIQGTFSLGEDDQRLSGVIIPDEGRIGYQIETGRDGAAYLLEKEKSHILCMELPIMAVSRANVRESSKLEPAAGDTLSTSASFAASATLPEKTLSSRPGAAAVIYLDFDGELVSDPGWNGGNTINASASGLSGAQIIEVWQRVAEDFRPFNVDVTTIRARYDNASAGSRMRCIVTQNNAWYGSAGGVAYIGSWKRAGSGGVSATTPCWVFSNLLALNSRYVAEAVSHEVGHTLGLSHDGSQTTSGVLVSYYYSGHGTGATSWAPIMGNSYYNTITQWSKGDYNYNGNVGNNTEDDLAIISDAANRLGYAPDNQGGTFATANTLDYVGAEVIAEGTIERTGDVDMYRFTTAGGGTTLYLAPKTGSVSAEAMLNARATLYNSAGSIVADSNPTGSLYPSISVSLSAGTYYLAVTGSDEGSIPGTGFTRYGSLGSYLIRGSGVQAVANPVIVVDSEDTVNASITGTWTPSTYYSGYNGRNYLSDGKTGATGGKRVRFAPALPVSAAYDVYIRWCGTDNRASNAPVDIAHANGTSTVTVNQRTNHATWVFLGTYGFHAGNAGSVTLRNDGANGFVTADAVKFEKASSIIPATQTIIVDAADSSGVTRSGTWTASTYVSGYHGSNYLTDDNTGRSQTKSVSFRPSLPVRGEYLVYAKWTAASNRATNTPIDITSTSGTTRVLVNQQANNGVWFLLGKYTFDAGSAGSVTIGNQSANGYVIADAIKFETAP